VVSEERGEMSLCFHGNIARDLDAATLRKALLGLFYREKGKKRRIAEEAKAAAAAAHGMFAFALRDTKPRTAITMPEGAPEGDAETAAGAEPREPGAKSERQTRPDLPAQTPPRPRTAPPEAG
jgi:diadenylate cyclase